MKFTFEFTIIKKRGNNNEIRIHREVLTDEEIFKNMILPEWENYLKEHNAEIEFDGVIEVREV